jgi:two-component system, OmpR family, response regulator AdeR
MLEGRLILIAEDEEEISEVLDIFLVNAGFRTVVASDGRRAVELCQSAHPDLMLLDIRLPEVDGHQVLNKVRRFGFTPIIMVTAMADDVDRLLGLEMGADDYIVKPFNPKEVVARVKAVLRRTYPQIGPRVLRISEIELDAEAHDIRVRGTSLSITPTEFRLLEHMFGRPNRVFSRIELMEACLPSSDAADRAIDNHLSALRKKLETAGAVGWINAVRGVGYRLKAES